MTLSLEEHHLRQEFQSKYNPTKREIIKRVKKMIVLGFVLGEINVLEKTTLTSLLKIESIAVDGCNSNFQNILLLFVVAMN